LPSDEKRELAELRTKARGLEVENEIPKRAAAYFAGGALLRITLAGDDALTRRQRRAVVLLGFTLGRLNPYFLTMPTSRSAERPTTGLHSGTGPMTPLVWLATFVTRDGPAV
jgi:hypothetical protein